MHAGSLFVVRAVAGVSVPGDCCGCPSTSPPPPSTCLPPSLSPRPRARRIFNRMHYRGHGGGFRCNPPAPAGFASVRAIDAASRGRDRGGVRPCASASLCARCRLNREPGVGAFIVRWLLLARHHGRGSARSHREAHLRNYCRRLYSARKLAETRGGCNFREANEHDRSPGQIRLQRRLANDEKGTSLQLGCPREQRHSAGSSSHPPQLNETSSRGARGRPGDTVRRCPELCQRC